MANGNVLGTYEFQFNFNAKDAKKQILSISNDFKSQLQEMDTASSKMSVLSNIVGYLEKLDKALDQFKAEHKDDFKNMFAGLDDQLAGSLKSMLGMSMQDWDKLTGIKGRIDAAKANKAKLPELRAIAQDLNSLFTMIGDREFIDIDKMFKQGKGVNAKFDDRIKILSNALDEFYMSYQFVTNSIKDGFGTGGMAGISKMSEEAKQEAQALRDSARELRDAQQQMLMAQSDIHSAEKGNKGIQEKYRIDLTADAVRGLIDDYESLDSKLRDSKLSAKEYCDTLLQMSEVIIKLKNAQKAVEANEDFKGVLSNESGYTGGNTARPQDSFLSGSLSLYSKVLSKDLMDRRMGNQFAVYIQDIIDQKMQRFVELVPNIIGNGLSGTHGTGSGTGDGSGSGIGGLSLDKLKAELDKYKSMFEQSLTPDLEEDELVRLEEECAKIINGLVEICRLSESAGDEFRDIFVDYEEDNIDFNELTAQVTKFLGISDQISDSTFKGVGQHAVTATEYIHAMTNAIREMFDVLSKSSDIEYKALIGGTDIAIRAGQEGEISAKTTAEAFLANLMQDTDVEAHSHMGRGSFINAPDFLQAKRHQYGGLAKISAVIGGKDIVTLDLSKVKMEDADVAYKKLQEVTSGSGRTEIPVEELNKILTDINPEYTDVARKWDPSNFRELATYIYSVKQSAEQSIGPLEKLQQLLNVLAHSKVINYSKYSDMLNGLTKDNVGEVFNHIAKAEGITEDNETLQVDAGDISTISVDALIADIQRKKDLLDEKRKALQITYQEIEDIAEKYAKTRSSKDSEERNFFKQYFHASELPELDKLFIDKASGDIGMSDVVKNIAARFGVQEPSHAEETVQQSAEEQAEAIEYAKKILTKAWQDYYKAAQDAKEAGIRIEDGEVSEEMQNIQNSITKMVDQWKTRLPNGKDASWHLAALDGYITDEKEAWTFDEIKHKISEAFDDNKITLGIPLDEIKKQASGLEELQEEIKSTAQAAEQTGEATKNAQAATATSEAEVAQMGELAGKVKEVTESVEAKTRAFGEEAVAVDEVVTKEIESLDRLKEYLENLQRLISQIFSGEQLKIGELDGIDENEKSNTGKSSIPGLLGEISAHLSSICGILEGVTGVKSKGEDSVTKTKPVVEDAIGGDGLDDQDFGVLNQMLGALKEISGTLTAMKSDVDSGDTSKKSYAFDDTLQQTNVILNNILGAVKNEVQEGKNISNVQESISKLINALTPAVSTLYDVASGIVQAQERTKTSTSLAQARIANNQTRNDLVATALGAVDYKKINGGSSKVTAMIPRTDGIVEMVGYIQTATDEWEQFTLQVDEANKVSILAYDVNGRAAKEAARAAKALKKEEENNPKYNPLDTAKKAREELRKRGADDTETTVQFKDSGRYTVTSKKTIGNLSQEIFQTFDEDVKAMERTTVTVSDHIATELARAHKFITDNSANIDSKLLQDYKSAHDMLVNTDWEGNNDLDGWNKQIELVKHLGKEVQKVIEAKRKLNEQPNAVANDTRLKAYLAQVNDAFKSTGIDVNAPKTKEEEAIVAARDAALNKLLEVKTVQGNLVDLNGQEKQAVDAVVKALTDKTSAYIQTKKNAEAAKQAQDALNNIPTAKSDQAKNLKDFTDNLKNSNLLTADLSGRLTDINSQLNNVQTPDQLDEWIEKFGKLQTDIETFMQSLKQAGIVGGKSKVDDTQQFILDNIDDVTNDNLFNAYADAHAELVDIQNKYAKQPSLSQADIDAWKSQIDHVRLLGDQIEKLIIKRQQLAAQPGVALSAEKLGKYQSDAKSMLKDSGFDINKEEDDVVYKKIKEIYGKIHDKTKELQGSKAVLTDDQIAEFNSLMANLETWTKRYSQRRQDEETRQKFNQDKLSQQDAFDKYKNGLSGMGDMSDEVKHKLEQLGEELKKIGDQDALDAWKKSFEELQSTVSKGSLSEMADLKRQTSAQVRGLDFKDTDTDLDDEQKEIIALRKQLMTQIDEYVAKVKNGETAEINGINATKEALNEKIRLYKEAHNTSEQKANQGVYTGELNKYKRDINKAMNNIGFNATDESLEGEQKKIADMYMRMRVQIEECTAAAKRGEEVQLSGIRDIVAELQKEINLYKQANGIFDNNKVNRDVAKAERGYNLATYNSKAYSGSEVITEKLQKYKAALDDLKDLQKKANSVEGLTADEATKFDHLIQQCNRYAQAIDGVIQSSDKLAKSQKTIDVKPVKPGTNVDDIHKIQNALEGYVNETYDAKAAIDGFNSDTNTLTFTVKEADGTIRRYAASLNAAKTAIVTTYEGVGKETSLLGELFGGLKRKMKELWTYAAARLGVDELIQAIRTGIQYVREIDSALTELKKVTNETDATYSRFLQNMSKTASVVGSTVKDLTTMAAEWSRLGYSLEESAELAKNTAILLNVSEFTDATQASEALISTMQAFQYTADESGHVVDILNEVGNNYAVSSDGIATALKDSASALMEGGNNLEQATALVAAANRVVQDPNSVGSALRTISLRLRGTSVEVLEEMGEATDGVVESTSKLQEKLKALTGVDILTNTGAYKDTYTILKEIGSVWQDLGSLDQAAALELMAGKNRANTLSAILNNMSDLEGAYESAMSANGSAIRENETYLDSIEGKISKFNNAVQTMWMNFMNDDAVKWIVDLGTATIKLINTLKLVPTAAAGLTAIKTFSVSAKDSLSALGEGLSGLITNFGKEGVKNLGATIASQAGSILGSLGKGLLFGGAAYVLTTGISHIITAIDKLAHSTERAVERADEALNKYSDKQKELKDQKTTVDELSDSYIRLSSGVNTLTNDNIGLTVESYEEYLDVVNQIADLHPELVAGYDAEGNAILTLKGRVDQLADSYRKAQEEAALELLTSKNKTDIWKKYTSGMDTGVQYIDENSGKSGWGSVWQDVTADNQKDIVEAILAMSNEELTQFYEYDKTGNDDMWGILRKQLSDMGTVLDEGLVYAAFNKGFSIGDDELHSLDTYKAYFINQLSTLNQTISESMSGIRQTVAASLVFDPIYQQLDSESQDLVNILINNLDPKLIADAGVKSTQGLIEWFSGNVIAQIDENSNLYNDITDASNNLMKAMADGDSDAYQEAKSEWSSLVENMERDVNGNIQIDPDADIVTQYLQQLAKDIENQSKNYEVKLQMQMDFDSAKYIDDIVDDTNEKARRAFFEDLELGENATMQDLYEKIGTSLNDGNGVLRVDEVQSAYQAFLNGDMNDWSMPQREAIVALDQVVKMYGTDIDTVISQLVELGYVSKSINDIASFSLASEKTNEAIDAFQDTISSLKDAWGSLNSKEMTKSEFIDLAQEFPELMKDVDLSDDNWMVRAKENIEALNAVKVDDFVKSLEEMKEAMIERGEDQAAIDMVDSFINYAKEARAINEVTNAQAEYYRLVRSYGDEVRGPSIANVNEETTASIRKQIEAIKESINQYERLEDTLLGTTSAFDRFAKAQEADSKNTYGEQYIEMAQTMYDALYKTGEVGSEAFWAAVRAYVPDDEYVHLLPGKEQLNAIRDYLNDNVFSSLTFDEGAFSIDYSSIEKFVEKAQSVGVFTGTDSNAFGLSADFINNLQKDEDALEKFADQMGMTATQVYAMLAAMDQYNANGVGLSMLLQLDTSTAGQITLVTSQLEQLYTQREALLKQGTDDVALGYNMDEIAATEAQLGSLQQQAVESVKAYAMVENALKATEEKVATVLPESIYTEIGLTGEENVKDVLQTIEGYLIKISEPAVVELEIARQEIEDLESTDPTITAHVKIDDDGLYELINEEDYHGEIDLQHYVDLKNAESLIDKSLSENLTKSETYLSEIAENTRIMAGENDTDNAPEESNGNDVSTDKNPVHGGAGGKFGKPTIDTEATELHLNTMKDFYNLGEAIAKERAMLSSKGAMDFLQQSTYDNLGKLQKEATEIYDKLNEGAMSAEEAIPKFSELLSQAVKFGIKQPSAPSIAEVPSWLDVTSPEGKLFGDAILGRTNNGADSMMPQYGEAYTDPATIAPEQVVITDSNLQIDGADNKIEGPDVQQYDTFIKELETFDPNALLPAEKIQDMGLKEIADEAITAGDALEYFANKKQDAMVPGTAGALFDATAIKEGVLTYSELQNEVTSFNELLDQTDEIIGDNTEVTQAYRDLLLEMCETEQERADVKAQFDEHDGKLIVKNSRALKKLVREKKKELASDVKLAKAHAQLEYYDLYKQMHDLVNSTEVMDSTTLNYINSLYEEMGAIQRTIAKYSMLEAQLLGTSNAYDKLAEAQEADAATDYGSKAEELMGVLGEAFTTGQLGTQAAQVAIEGLVPESVYQDVDDLDEKMKKIYKYFTGGEVSKLFTVKYTEEGELESVEMTEKNVEDYTDSLFKKTVDSALGEGTVFQGTWDEFTLNPAIQTLEDFAKACGLTEEVAFAFLTELEKYDINWLGGDFETLLDQLMGDDLAYGIQEATKAMADQEIKMAELRKKVADGELSTGDQEYINAQKEYDVAQAELESKEEQAIVDVTDWSNKTKALEEQKKHLEDLAKDYEELKASDMNADEKEEELERLNAEMDSTTETIDGLISDLDELGAPTEFVIEVASAEAQENIDKFKEKWEGAAEDGDKKAVKITAAVEEIDTAGLDGLEKLGFTQNSDGTWEAGADVKIKGWSELDTASQQEIIDYINMLEEQHTIDLLLGGGTKTVEDHLSDISRTLEHIAQLFDPTYTIDVNTKNAQSKISTFKTSWDGIKSKTVTVWASIKKTASSLWNQLTGRGGVNGTAHVQGTAFKSGSWGAKETETALVGELGPELLVRGNRWTTIGENGAEFRDIRKGDIIFNHKQTEDLLSKGYVTGRGKAFAEGTAYAGINTWTDTVKGSQSYNSTLGKEISNSASKLSKAASDISKSSDKLSDDFKEIFDWIEVRIEEITEDLDLKSAKLENANGSKNQNVIIDDMIDLNKHLYDNLTAGASKYYEYAAKLLEKVPSEYRDAAQNGSIAIESFVGKVGESTLEAIQDYREWVQKGADATQQAEETLTEISSLAKQAIDNISADYENKRSSRDNTLEQYEAYNSLLETDLGFESEKIYNAMIAENKQVITMLGQQRDAMQAELNKRVESGEIKKYSQDWYDAVNDIAAVDVELIELRTDVEDLQDSINDLHWDKFDALIGRLEMVSDEAENLIDILSNSDVVDEAGNWTDEGITQLGLYAQKMEAAEVQAKKYEEEIAYLNDNWEKLGYTEQEYIEKLDELKSGQYDAIQAYHDTKDAIVDLNSERVEAIKEGIQKEIDAYTELIEKKKEELDAEKDLYDFQKSVMEQEKDIADIQRKLAALSGDNSASARAKRAQLQAELAEANAALEESYYERSVSKQQEALDRELENFQEAKDKEMEGWDEYLEDTNKVVSDSLTTIQANTDVVYQTLKALGQEYSLSITESLTSPWKEGEYAIQSFSEQFGISMSATVEELQALALKFKETMLEIEQAGTDAVNNVQASVEGYTKAEYKEPVKKEEPKAEESTKQDTKEETKTIKVGGKIDATGAKIYDSATDKTGERQYYRNDPIYVVLEEKNGRLKVRYHKSSKGATGWFNKSDVKAYAKGTTGVSHDQLSIIDELGLEEIVMHAENGKLAYLTKGSAVIPHDISENLMELGKLDPSIILDRNKPKIGLPAEIHNTEIHIDNSVAELIHIDNCSTETLPDVKKIVNEALEKHTQKLNNSLKRYTR